jgi:hypothetical protein
MRLCKDKQVLLSFDVDKKSIPKEFLSGIVAQRKRCRRMAALWDIIR